jgi:hypothetical protein
MKLNPATSHLSCSSAAAAAPQKQGSGPQSQVSCQATGTEPWTCPTDRPPRPGRACMRANLGHGLGSGGTTRGLYSTGPGKFGLLTLSLPRRQWTARWKRRWTFVRRYGLPSWTAADSSVSRATWTLGASATSAASTQARAAQTAGFPAPWIRDPNYSRHGQPPTAMAVQRCYQPGSPWRLRASPDATWASRVQGSGLGSGGPWLARVGGMNAGACLRVTTSVVIWTWRALHVVETKEGHQGQRDGRLTG